MGLFTSKKFYTAVGTIVTTQHTADPIMQKITAVAGTALILAQGLKDFGTNKH